MAIQKIDLSTIHAIEDAAIHASNAEHKSATGTQELIASLVAICPTDKKGQELWLSSKLPALVRGWDAERNADGALVVVADGDSTRSARKRLVGAVKNELDGSLTHDFTFVGKSKKVNGAMVSFYEWMSTNDAETLADKRAKTAAQKKTEKQQDIIKKETAAITQAVSKALENTVSISEHEQLKRSILSPQTATPEQALSQMSAWARAVNKHGATVSDIQHALSALSALVTVSAKAPAKPEKVKPAKNRDTLAA